MSNAYIESEGGPRTRPLPIAQTDTLSGFDLLYTPFAAPQDNGKRHLRTGTIIFRRSTQFCVVLEVRAYRQAVHPSKNDVPLGSSERGESRHHLGTCHDVGHEFDD